MQRKKIILLLLLFLYFIFLSPLFEWSLTTKAIAMLAIAQILWMSGVFNLMYASFVVLLLLSFHFFTFEKSMSFIGTDIVWLLFATFVIAGAFMNTGLSLRIALIILKLSRGQGSALLLMSFFMMCVLALLIPANAGRASLVITIIVGMLNYLKELINLDQYGKALMIGMNYTVILSGALIITGSNSSIYAFGLFNDESMIEWNYIIWLQLFVPPIILMLILLWLILLWFFPIPRIDRHHVLVYIQDQIKQMGSFSWAEIRLSVIAVMTLLLWMFEPYHPFSIPMVGMFGALLTVLPHIGVWDWEDARESIDWSMLVFFGASLAIAEMLIYSGALESISSVIVLSQAMIASEWITLLFLGIIGLLLRMIFLNVIGFMTIMLPLSLMIGHEMDSLSPTLIAMFTFLIGSQGFFLTTQTPINMLSFQYGYYSKKDLFKVGCVVGIVWLIVIWLTSYFYWSLFQL